LWSYLWYSKSKAPCEGKRILKFSIFINLLGVRILKGKQEPGKKNESNYVDSLLIIPILIRCRAFPRASLVSFLQTLPKFSRKFIETFFTSRFQVEFVELGFLRHFCVTNRTSEMVNTPGFVQCGKHWKEKPIKVLMS
jgi:hypothetical protein